MARKTEVREYGPNHFRARQLKVRQANRVLERLLIIVGESLGAIADNVGSGETGGDASLVGDLRRGALSDAAGKLVKNMSGDDLNWLIEELRPSIEYQTPELRAAGDAQFVPLTGDLWDDVFAGELGTQFKVIAWVLQLNFASFFDGAEGITGAFRQFVTPTRSSSSSPTIPTPGSGS